MLITHLTIAGDAAVAAEVGNNPETDERAVRLYLGDALTVEMPLSVADAVGDALADADDVVSFPRAGR